MQTIPQQRIQIRKKNSAKKQAYIFYMKSRNKKKYSRMKSETVNSEVLIMFVYSYPFMYIEKKKLWENTLEVEECWKRGNNSNVGYEL